MNPKEKKALRKKYYINGVVQGTIIKQSIFRWYLCTSLILFVVAIFMAYRNPSESPIVMFYEMWNQFAPAIVASVLLAPVFIYDVLKASHKIAGPLHRLQSEMKKLTDGENIKPLHFRDGDYWQELADQFNELSAVVQAERDLNQSDVRAIFNEECAVERELESETVVSR